MRSPTPLPLHREPRADYVQKVTGAAVFASELINKACVTAAFIWLARALTPSVYGEVEWALSFTIMATVRLLKLICLQ